MAKCVTQLIGLVSRNAEFEMFSLLPYWNIKTNWIKSLIFSIQ